MPTIEVRFEHLTVEAQVYLGSRALPTLLNFAINMIQVSILLQLDQYKFYSKFGTHLFI